MFAQRINLEGNIGAGKTSLICELTQLAGGERVTFTPFLEPIKEWESNGNILEGFYSNQVGAAFTAQSYISQTLLKRDLPRHLKEAADICLYDQSLYSAHHCFVPALEKEGKLTNREISILVRTIKKTKYS